MAMSVLPHRALPALTALNESFWTSGRDGALRILRCGACGQWIHPPSPLCSACLSRDVAPAAASGHGTVHSFTVNHQQWIPGTAPYVIGLVELDEQIGLRLTTNIVGCDPATVTIGMRVDVCFEEHNAVWLPLFRPATE